MQGREHHSVGIDIVHVPYKGAGPAVTDLLSGQIQMMMVTPLLLVEPHARDGRLRLVAAATAQRIPGLPNLPTVAESGVPGLTTIVGIQALRTGHPKMQERR